MPNQHYAVVIVGGGMVGASFASLLAERLPGKTASILVIDALAEQADEQVSFDARSTALSWSSRRIFEEMGLWAEIEQATLPIEDIHVSQRGQFGAVRLSRREHGQRMLGYVAENSHLGRCLRARLADLDSVHMLSPAQVTAVQPRATGMELTITGQAESIPVSADLVVLADGGRSNIIEQLGIEQTRKVYDQHALIANVGFSQPHRNVAFERFTESGPLAILPLRNHQQTHRGALVWTLPAAEEQVWRDMEDSEFLSRLQEAFGYRLGRFDLVGDRQLYPLGLTVAREQIRPGLVLLGNVAHTLHPVAGQGFNLALRDCAELVRTLARASSQSVSLGSFSVLNQYLAQQALDQQRSILFTDQLIGLFTGKGAVRSLARRSGMLALDLLPSLRRQFARQAMGFPI